MKRKEAYPRCGMPLMFKKTLDIMKLATLLIIATYLPVSAQPFSVDSNLDQPSEKYIAEAADIKIEKDSDEKNQESTPQQKSVSGNVTDVSGAAMPGVSVIVKGTNNGTITGTDGNFTLTNVPDNATLQFTFIGYKMLEVSVGQNIVINVVLEEEKFGLDEVVVVGYGAKPKETLTGAITQIRYPELLTTKSNNLVSNLQGKISGLHIRKQTGEPGKFTSMMSIRGFGTPLIVIDGVARDGVAELERLNPEDIETISVLKDATSAIYGINADNGVVIVTTKKGSQGDAKISYSGYFSLASPTILQRTVDAYTSMLLRNEMAANSKAPLPFADPDLLEKYRLGTEPGYQDYDWVSNMMNDVVLEQQHNISVRGGSEKVSYYSSFNWSDNNGILSSGIQNYKKYNFRTNLSVKLNDNLVSNINVSGRYDKNNGPQGTFFWLLKPIMTVDRRYSPHSIANPEHLTLIPGNSNPFALMTENVSGYDRWEDTQYQTSVDLVYTVPFVEGLKLKVMGAYDGNVRNASHLSKVYTLYDYYTDDPTLPTGNSTYSNSASLFNRTDFQAQALYDNTFSENHRLTATLVYEMKSTTLNYLAAQRQYDELYTNDILDQADLTNLSNGGNRAETAFMSLLGRFNYDYKSKYLLELAFRRDGSYRYAPAKRWGLFPAVSAGWRISEESFMKNKFDAITNLKIRGSYGIIGADPENSPPFQYVGGYTVGDVDRGYVFNDGVLTKAMISPGVINDNLTWIKSKTADIGIDIDLWKGKLSMSADVFQKDRTGLLGYRIVSIPNTFGGTFPQENLNSDRVKGYDFMISHKNHVNKFFYGISANITYARTQKIYTERGQYGSTWEMWHDMNANGRLQGAQWGFEYDGVYTSIEDYQTAPLYNGYWAPNAGNSLNLPGTLKIIDTNGDGKINDLYQLQIFWSGRINAPLQYGMNFSASWNGFDFNALLQVLERF